MLTLCYDEPPTSCCVVLMQPHNHLFGLKISLHASTEHISLSVPLQEISPAGARCGRPPSLLLLPYLNLLFLHPPCVQTSVERNVKLWNLPSRCDSCGFEERRRRESQREAIGALKCVVRQHNQTKRTAPPSHSSHHRSIPVRPLISHEPFG